jgi:hypothetical protein
MPAFDSATASIAIGRPDCATSWYQCNASIRFFLDLSLRLAHDLRAFEISVGYSARKRRPRRVSIARGHRGNEPASTVEAFCDSVDRARAAVRLARRIAMGLHVDKGALARKSVSAGCGVSSLASCTKVEKNPSGSLRGLCDLVAATRTVLSHFPAFPRTCSACVPLRTWGGDSRDAARSDLCRYCSIGPDPTEI